MARLRLGLVALVAALVVDIVDLQFDDLDVMHDGLELALYAVAGWGLAQGAARRLGAFTPFFWVPAGACGLALLMELSDATWTYDFLNRLVAFLMTDPRPELPFRHAPGSIDSTWWKQAIAWACVVGAVLAAFDTAMAAATTFRSAGRRTSD